MEWGLEPGPRFPASTLKCPPRSAPALPQTEGQPRPPSPASAGQGRAVIGFFLSEPRMQPCMDLICPRKGELAAALRKGSSPSGAGDRSAALTPGPAWNPACACRWLRKQRQQQSQPHQSPFQWAGLSGCRCRGHQEGNPSPFLPLIYRSMGPGPSSRQEFLICSQCVPKVDANQ